MIQKHYMDIDGIRECQCELMNVPLFGDKEYIVR